MSVALTYDTIARSAAESVAPELWPTFAVLPSCGFTGSSFISPFPADISGTTQYDISGYTISGANSGVVFPSRYMPLDTGTIFLNMKSLIGSNQINRYFVDSDTKRHAFFLSAQNTVQMYLDGSGRSYSLSYAVGEIFSLTFVYDKASGLKQPYKNGNICPYVAGSDTWGNNSLGNNAYFFQRFNGVENHNCVFYVGLIYNTVLPQSEIQRLTADPLLPFRRRRLRSWFLPSASGFKPAWWTPPKLIGC